MNKNIILGIVGTRTFQNYNLLKKELNKCTEQFTITNIVTGGASGADTLAVRYAKEELNITNPIIHLPEWSKYGKSAGPKRNKLIVDDSDYVIAFWDNKSNGTESSINIAKSNDKLLKVVNY
jgi:hypothetical protein